MLDFIADLVTVNEEVNYSLLLGLVFIYIASIWLVIVIWVFFNARTRYKTVRMALLWAFLVLILNVPLLILYLILRPEEDWFTGNEAHGYEQNIPVVEVQDANGVKVFLELKLITSSSHVAPVAEVKVIENVAENRPGYLSRLSSFVKNLKPARPEKIKTEEVKVEEVAVEPKLETAKEEPSVAVPEADGQFHPKKKHK